MRYDSTIKISKKINKAINEYLEDTILAEGETHTETAVFSNGMVMDIKCCGSRDDVAWTEAVLFAPKVPPTKPIDVTKPEEYDNAKNGVWLNEVAHTEVADEFTGEWELEYNGDTYVVNVVVGK